MAKGWYNKRYKTKARMLAHKAIKRAIRKPRVSLAVKKYVKSTIHKNIENKSYQVGYSASLGGYNTNNTLYAFPLTPYTGGVNITQGVTQSTRIGNQVKPRKLLWDFVLSPRPYDAANNVAPQPLEVEMIICSLRPANGEMPTSTDVANFYQLNNSSIAPSGQLYDMTQKINTDLFHVYKRMHFKLGFANSGGTGVNAAYQSFANNDYKMNIHRKINVTKYCPKVITWNDNVVSPTSRCVFVLFNVLPSVGGSAFAAGQAPLRIDSTLSLDFEDA